MARVTIERRVTQRRRLLESKTSVARRDRADGGGAGGEAMRIFKFLV